MKKLKHLSTAIASYCLIALPTISNADTYTPTNKNELNRFFDSEPKKDLTKEEDYKSQSIINEDILIDGAPAITIIDGEKITNSAVLQTTGLTDTVSIAGNKATFNNQENGEVSSEFFGVSARGSDNAVHNTGAISGDIFGVNFDVDSSGVLNNSRIVSSNGRAVHVAGADVTVINSGEILGTGDQFDGTLYLDAPGEKISVLNYGLIDAGTGNNGSGASFEIGDQTGDVVNVDLVNNGTIRGQGIAAEGTLVGDAVRVFSVLFEDTVARGKITNRGEIIGSKDSNDAVGISIENGTQFLGSIVNHGLISGTVTAIDASDAGGHVLIRNNGRIEGDVILSAGNDIFNGRQGKVSGVINAGAGNDRIFGGSNNDVIIGGEGNDRLFGGLGNDTVNYEGRTREDFTIKPRAGSRTIVVTDNVSGEIDVLSNIETASFADEDVQLKREYPSLW